MHRDIVDQIHSSLETDFVMTTSLEGNIKFWKKNYIGIEFVKQLKAHQGKISGISVSKSGLYLATCSYKDESLKIFDISNFDMIYFMKLSFIPHHCEFITKVKDPNLVIAISEKETGNIHLVRSESKGEISKTVNIHSNPITSIKYNEDYDTVISTDNSGMIEYWDPKTLGRFFIKILILYLIKLNFFLF
jgi:peptidylprolyl isomerase domain and WD repeat-containing protein 1